MTARAGIPPSRRLQVKQTVLIIALAVLGGTAARAARTQHPDLSGHWVFNQGQSDNPRNMMPAGDSGGGGRRGGFGGGRGGRMGGGGGRGGGMSDDQRARMRQ